MVLEVVGRLIEQQVNLNELYYHD